MLGYTSMSTESSQSEKGRSYTGRQGGAEEESSSGGNATVYHGPDSARREQNRGRKETEQTR